MLCREAILILLFYSTAAATDTFPNIGYLGRGYDIFYGNPSNTYSGTDPGFRSQVFDFEYNDEMTPDRKYKIPDGVEVQRAEACSISFSSTTIETGSEYQKNLDRHVSTTVSGAYKSFKASFTASKDYKSVVKSTADRKNVFIVTEGTCSKYDASILQFVPPKVSRNFKAAVTQYLPSSRYDKRKLARIVASFGTHVAVSLTMGARYGMISEVDEDEWTKYKQTTRTWKTEASASVIVSYSQKTSQTETITKANNFKKVTKSQKIYSMGSRPPPDNSATSWAQKAFENPMPISYKLERIDSILKPDYFPNYDTAKLAKKQALMKRYLDELCAELKKRGEVKTCNPVDPPKPPPKTCRLCKTCARRGDYSIEAGSIIHKGDWGPWDMHGAECGGLMTKSWDVWRLCCSPPEPHCQLCKSCGGGYPFYAGGKLNQGDWGPYRVRQANCEGAYNQWWGEFKLCCRSAQNACRICEDCGTGMQEVGRRIREGDWGPFQVLPRSRCSSKGTNVSGAKKYWGEFKICCPRV